MGGYLPQKVVQFRCHPLSEWKSKFKFEQKVRVIRGSRGLEGRKNDNERHTAKQWFVSSLYPWKTIDGQLTRDDGGGFPIPSKARVHGATKPLTTDTYLDTIQLVVQSES